MDGRQKGLRVAAIRRVVFCVPGWPVTRFKDLVSSIRPSFCLLTPACPVKLRQHHFTGVFCLLPPIFPLFHVVFFCLLTTDSCILLQHSSSPCFFLPLSLSCIHTFWPWWVYRFLIRKPLRDPGGVKHEGPDKKHKEPHLPVCGIWGFVF